MAAAKQVRWVCPDCGQGALGPSRPRRENIVRYCLPCSKRTGKLVERTVPSLEAKREQRTAASRARAAEKAKAEYAKRFVIRSWDAAEVEHEVDVPVTLARMARLKAFKGTPAGRIRKASDWEKRLTIHRSKWKSGTGGHAKSWTRSIHLTAGMHDSYERLLEVILHEIAHVAVYDLTAHDMAFKRKLVEAAQEMWPGIRVGSLRDGAYVIDNRIHAELEAMTLADNTERREVLLERLRESALFDEQEAAREQARLGSGECTTDYQRREAKRWRDEMAKSGRRTRERIAQIERSASRHASA